MIAKMSNHGHAVIGAEIKIIPLPPFIEIEPIATFASMDDESDRISKHKHELAELPSLGISFQQLLNNRFSIHVHMMEGASIGVDVSAFTCTCTPPPVSVDSEKSSISEVRTKLCSREQLISFLRNQIIKRVNQQIKRNQANQTNGDRLIEAKKKYSLGRMHTTEEIIRDIKAGRR
jgi:hypothetical protein